MTPAERHGLLLRAAWAPEPDARAAVLAWSTGVDFDRVDDVEQQLLAVLALRPDVAELTREPGRVRGLHRRAFVRNSLLDEQMTRLQEALTEAGCVVGRIGLSDRLTGPGRLARELRVGALAVSGARRARVRRVAEDGGWRAVRRRAGAPLHLQSETGHVLHVHARARAPRRPSEPSPLEPGLALLDLLLSRPPSGEEPLRAADVAHLVTAEGPRLARQLAATARVRRVLLPARTALRDVAAATGSTAVADALQDLGGGPGRAEQLLRGLVPEPLVRLHDGPPLTGGRLVRPVSARGALAALHRRVTAG